MTAVIDFHDTQQVILKHVKTPASNIDVFYFHNELFWIEVQKKCRRKDRQNIHFQLWSNETGMLCLSSVCDCEMLGKHNGKVVGLQAN